MFARSQPRLHPPLAVLSAAPSRLLLGLVHPSYGPGHTGGHRGAGGVAVYQDAAYSGEVYVDDRKARGRRRTFPLTGSLCREVVAFAADKGPDAPVLSLTYNQVDVRWKRVRTGAGLPRLRFKDLRAQFALGAEQAGIPLTVASRAMGHSDVVMTRRYQQRQTVLSADQAGAIEREMGLAAYGPDAQAPAHISAYRRSGRSLKTAKAAP